jgi:integrase
MTIKDREVPGLFKRNGKRGATWNYARNRNGKMIRAALGSVDLHTREEARLWAQNLMRRTNCCTMKWCEIDFSSGTWTIPASKFKTKVRHIVNLVPEVIAALNLRRAETPADCPWVFLSPTMPGRPISDPSSAKQRICRAAGIPATGGVTIHDLRRTLGSQLAARVPLAVVAQVLGHKSINTTMRAYAVIDNSTARDALMALAAERLEVRQATQHGQDSKLITG